MEQVLDTKRRELIDRALTYTNAHGRRLERYVKAYIEFHNLPWDDGCREYVQRRRHE